MTKLLVYGYCTGVFSSRRIQKRLQEDIPFKVLAAGNEPDFRTISDFRKIHIGTLQGLFEQVLEMALEVGAVKIGRVTLDGTKVKANASKHKAMSTPRESPTNPVDPPHRSRSTPDVLPPPIRANSAAAGLD